MFVEVTPVEKKAHGTSAVTINFNDVRSFHYDQNVDCTILRFFDESRTNLKVQERQEIIQSALAKLGSFYSAAILAEEAENINAAS